MLQTIGLGRFDQAVQTGTGIGATSCCHWQLHLLSTAIIFAESAGSISYEDSAGSEMALPFVFLHTPHVAIPAVRLE